MSRKRTEPKIAPWPNSTFALKTRWENWGTDKHFWVYLERRAAGKFGRLEAMHGIVPSRRSKRNADPLFASARYRKAVLDRARDVFERAGVPEDQASGFMDAIRKEFPAPTAEELFLESINGAVTTMVLGQRNKELSYYRTGVPELDGADMQLFKQCLEEWKTRMKTNPREIENFLKAAFF